MCADGARSVSVRQSSARRISKGHQGEPNLAAKLAITTKAGLPCQGMKNYDDAVAARYGVGPSGGLRWRVRGAVPRRRPTKS